MGPDPTLPALLRQTATKLAKEHDKGKKALPDTHVAFDHAVYTMLQAHVDIGKITTMDVDDWFTENAKSVREQKQAPLVRISSDSRPSIIQASRPPRGAPYLCQVPFTTLTGISSLSESQVTRNCHRNCSPIRTITAQVP